MRVPFIRARKMQMRDAFPSAAEAAENAAAGAAAAADQGAAVPLPRRRPGSHGVYGSRVVRAEPSPADPATLRKVLDGLNRI